ncbi:MAG: transposase [Alphaproteobacteria bacterium]|nr:transposase [Alphaproteobacteria bacterium]
MECHVVFCVRYGRSVNGNIVERCIEVIRTVRLANYVNIISGNISPDHVHMLSSMPPYLLISRTVQYIKGEVAGNCKVSFRN